MDSMTWRQHLLALLECSEGVSGPTSYAVRMVCSLLFQSVVEGADLLVAEPDDVAGWRVTPAKDGRPLPRLAVRVPSAAALDRARAALPAVEFVLGRPPESAGARGELALAVPPDDVFLDLAEYEKRREAWFNRPESPRHLGPSSETLLGFAQATFARREMLPVPVELCVLIVDDEADWRKDLTEDVRSVAPTARCITVGSAHEAREVLLREPVDWAIVDRRIPEMPRGPADEAHGRALLEWIRAQGRSALGTTAMAAADADFCSKFRIREVLLKHLRTPQPTRGLRVLQIDAEEPVAA